MLFAALLLVGLLIVPNSEEGEDWRLGAATLAGGIGLAGLALAGLAWTSLSLTALVLVGTGGLLGYAVHRYEQVRLGVVRDE